MVVNCCCSLRAEEPVDERLPVGAREQRLAQAHQGRHGHLGLHRQGVWRLETPPEI